MKTYDLSEATGTSRHRLLAALFFGLCGQGVTHLGVLFHEPRSNTRAFADGVMAKRRENLSRWSRAEPGVTVLPWMYVAAPATLLAVTGVAAVGLYEAARYLIF